MSLPPPPSITPVPVSDPQRYASWLRQALALAAASGDDVPVGALVLDPAGEVIATGVNRRELDGDPTAHAEVVALRAAANWHTRQGASGERGWRLDGCTLVVTLEPCPMCAGALMQARIARLVFGAFDPKGGACGSVWDIVRDRRATHRVEVVAGVLADECGRLLTDFFAARRLR